MLSWLKIKNYLLIEHLDIQLPDSFITLTGETGAGKSILLGAISLLTGKRADTSVLLDESKKCVVEAAFNVAPEHKAFFRTHDLDFESESIIRREISGKGKSRAFINDTPVKLDLLRELTDKLIDIHSQHQSLLVANSGFRLSVLDSYAGTATELAAYKKAFQEYTGLKEQLQELKDRQQAALKEKDYLQFQFQQLSEAVLNSGELEELEKEENLLNHAGEIESCLRNSVLTIRDQENSLLGELNRIAASLNEVKQHFEQAEGYAERLESAIIEIKDLADSFDQDAGTIEFNPARLGEVQNRINLLNDLLLKHQKQDVDELIDLRDELEERLLQMDTDSIKTEAMEKELNALYHDLKQKGQGLTAKRKKAVSGLEKKLKSMLAYLGMPDAVFHVQMKQNAEPAASGWDLVEFLFSANPDLQAMPIGRVASGGEMSRLMLCLKTIIAKKLRMPSIIFDEIDTGVSGEIAGKMGRMMHELGESAQVISITHLAQVAALGDVQFHVRKNKAKTSIKQLSEQERLQEIARMSSGENVGKTAIDHAKSLLEAKKS